MRRDNAGSFTLMALAVVSKISARVFFNLVVFRIVIVIGVQTIKRFQQRCFARFVLTDKAGHPIKCKLIRIFDDLEIRDTCFAELHRE